ncbi:polyketide biosynthesis enoyl-CoA hydratase PksH [Jatrophihabitans endophyticus]|uniref:Polyketide biosynthesis enoyl-CoA hydratase PksH n=1 Tax=Jatrophihabitans endophyticus TaxID=1206085 RepID=A0A1M5I611_9ACTN|nr:enoyl-CoA hydratase-related protein [Jatrophihabitans endophyticus]SHG23479.1 polyketide biosynthesis enoyl-CoA hydratase PksH [Jatrophihabitans endophyticus]
MEHPAVVAVSIDRGDGRNSLDDAMIGELDAGLTKAEADSGCRLFVVTGGAGVFSTGMDLAAAGSSPGTAAQVEPGGAYFDLLLRLVTTPRTVVTLVDGQAAGGGVGLVAASDVVLATGTSTFALPEALWGLLPCVVLPFLRRRIGGHRARSMMVTTQPVDAGTAQSWGLVDVVGDDLPAALRPIVFRAGKLAAETIGAAKRYAARLDPIDADTRTAAVSELAELLAAPAVQERLAAFAGSGKFPWES